MSGMYPFLTVKKGKGIFGIVELPDSGESFPAIIMLHGFELRKYIKTVMFIHGSEIVPYEPMKKYATKKVHA